MQNSETGNTIKQNRLVPVFNHSDLTLSRRVIAACYEAGLRVFEWTNRGEKAAEMFNEIRQFTRHNTPELLLGAGSIFTGMMAQQFIDMGADFIVSPVLDPDVRDVCHKHKCYWIPGAGTMTEIHQAQKWGADIVKIFPGESVGGPAFVKAIRGPMPWAQIMPTGGVSTDEKNLQAWFESGVCCVGMGSQLFTRNLIETTDPAQLISEIKKILKIINISNY